MNNHFIAGILAGLLTALLVSPLFAGIATPVAVLFYFYFLPILTVSLCFRHQTGLVAAMVSAIGLTIATASFSAGLFVLLGIGLPAWGLAYLLQLGRPSDDGMEWYPLGRLLLWVAGIASVLTTLFLLTISGGSYDEYMQLIQTLLNLMEPNLKEMLGSSYDPETFLSVLRAVIPSTMGAWLTFVLVLNLWLAARISTKFKKMTRPWSFIPAMRMPPAIVGLTFVGIVLAFLDGFPGLIGLGMRAVSYTALLFQGLAFTHFVTWQKDHRKAVLLIVYLSLPLTMMIGQGFLLYGFIAFGALDVLLDIRKKFGATTLPPNHS